MSPDKLSKKGKVDTLLTETNEQLAPLLLSVLERRYLNELQHESWNFTQSPQDNAFPLLREITQLGKPQSSNEYGLAMPHVLSACQSQGHAMIMTLHGVQGRHRLYIGGRRLIGLGAESTEDYLKQQEGAFKAYFPGLRMGEIQGLTLQRMPELTTFLQTAPLISVVTGIPSARINSLNDLQTLDKLIDAIGPNNYSLSVVAEPINAIEIDSTLDLCLQLKSELHSLIKTSKSLGRGESISETLSNRNENRNSTETLPKILENASRFCQAISYIPALNQYARGIQKGISIISKQVNAPNEESVRQVSENQSESVTSEILNSKAEFCEQTLQQYIKRLQQARSYGWWQTVVYISAPNDSVRSSIIGALRSFYSGDLTHLDPIREVKLPTHIVRDAVLHGRILQMKPNEVEQIHPLGKTYESLSTCLNSNELSIMFSLPQKELPGLTLRDWAQFAQNVPGKKIDDINLGNIQDRNEHSIGNLNISTETLNRHVFVTGMTGYGKTNTCMQLLVENYRRHNTPFLVIEPAKNEYRGLLNLPELEKSLRLYIIGDDSAVPFRLNPFALISGISLSRHIDLIKAVFNASFPMFAGMTYILEDALLEVYSERGWDIFDSTNRWLSKNSSFYERSLFFPTLKDLHDKIEDILAKKKYGTEVSRDMGAALRSRLNSLMVGQKGLTLNTRHSTPFWEIFDKPSIIELQNLSDDEEKSFVMALLFVFLYEYAEVKKIETGSEKLQHLTLIEEAHRLLRATSTAPGSGEIGDPRGKAVSMFTDMLAEMRAYGEGFIIADQIPTKLAPDTLKNTNLKIVHRLPAPDDKNIVGSCMNLDENQTAYLNNLVTGLTVIHDENIGKAVLVKVNNIKGKEIIQKPLHQLAQKAKQNISELSYLQKHKGCSSCQSPCAFYHKLDLQDVDQNLDLYSKMFLDSFFLGDFENAWQAVEKWKNVFANNTESPYATSDDRFQGLAFCQLTQSAYQWLDITITLRNNDQFRKGRLQKNRIIQERAAGILSKLILLCIKKPKYDSEIKSHFEKTLIDLRKIIAANPPVEIRGCVNCPARCVSLSFVKEDFANLEMHISKFLTLNLTPEGSIPQLRRALLPYMKKNPALAESTTGMQNNWLYCVLTNLSLNQGSESAREDLLKYVRDNPTNGSE